MYVLAHVKRTYIPLKTRFNYQLKEINFNHFNNSIVLLLWATSFLFLWWREGEGRLILKQSTVSCFQIHILMWLKCSSPVHRLPSQVGREKLRIRVKSNPQNEVKTIEQIWSLNLEVHRFFENENFVVEKLASPYSLKFLGDHWSRFSEQHSNPEIHMQVSRCLAIRK